MVLNVIIHVTEEDGGKQSIKLSSKYVTNAYTIENSSQRNNKAPRLVMTTAPYRLSYRHHHHHLHYQQFSQDMTT